MQAEAVGLVHPSASLGVGAVQADVDAKDPLWEGGPPRSVSWLCLLLAAWTQ